ncbi:MAG: serine hydrolase domain-containing protein [Bacteroidota bacterium]
MKTLYIILSLALILASCDTISDKSAQTKPSALEQLKSSIDSLFNAEIRKNEPGAALLVAYKGKMLIGKGYGLRDVDSQEPITASTNMRMASVSKQFTALCILALVDQGKLKLNDNAIDYLPYPIFEGITIEQLANHTSGLPDYYEYFNKNWNKESVLENQEVLDWLATNPERVFQPGEKWEYSNTAYLMLALIVEKVSGQEFSAFAKENVFQKAGMKNTNYYNLANPIEIAERAFCYEIDSAGNINKVDGFFMNGVMGDGAVYTSINDYFQYDLALRDSAILSPQIHEIIFKTSSEYEVNGTDRYYAMGWSVTDSTAAHTGGWYGTNTYTKRYLDRPLTYAIFMNRNTLFENRLLQKTDSLITQYLKNQNNL